jgi:polyhydroxyalkanoate synthase
MFDSSILDLQRDKSFIFKLLDLRKNIYLIDWKDPPLHLKDVCFNNYVNEYIDDCVKYVLIKEKVKKLILIGFSLGGTMSVMYTALHSHNVKNLITLAPIIDCSVPSKFANVLRDIKVGAILKKNGNFPKEHIYSILSQMFFKNRTLKHINLLEMSYDPNYAKNWLRIEKVFSEPHIIPGGVFKQWFKDILSDNLLSKNFMYVGESKIDLSKIDVPILNVIPESDFMNSVETRIALLNLVSSPNKSTMLFPTGTAGLLASIYSQKMVMPKIMKWIREH